MSDLAQQIRERLDALAAPPLPAAFIEVSGVPDEDLEAWQRVFDEVAEKALPLRILPPSPKWTPLPDPRNAAILSVLEKHPHFHAADGSGRHVDTLGYPYDFGCGKCHASTRGSRDLNGLGWCETVMDIARELGIEADRG